MGFITFKLDVGVAKIRNETSSEEGWVFYYDMQRKRFLVWANSEREAQQGTPDQICYSLEEVLSHINSYS